MSCIFFFNLSLVLIFYLWVRGGRGACGCVCYCCSFFILVLGFFCFLRFFLARGRFKFVFLLCFYSLRWSNLSTFCYGIEMFVSSLQRLSLIQEYNKKSSTHLQTIFWFGFFTFISSRYIQSLSLFGNEAWFYLPRTVTWIHLRLYSLVIP